MEPGEQPTPVDSTPRLVAQLAASTWWMLTPDGRSEKIVGLPFAGARSIDYWNEDPTAEPRMLFGDGAKTILGACDVRGAIYATTPLASDSALAEPLRKQVAGEGPFGSATIIEAERVVGFIAARVRSTWLDARLLQPDDSGSVVVPKQAVLSEAEVFGLVDEGAVRERVGMAGGENDSVAYIGWASLRSQGNPIVAIVIHTRDPQEDGKATTTSATFLVIRGDTLRRSVVEIGGFGC